LIGTVVTTDGSTDLIILPQLASLALPGKGCAVAAAAAAAAAEAGGAGLPGARFIGGGRVGQKRRRAGDDA
jgi:hypothetical protein